jgi:hypothetical protein
MIPLRTTESEGTAFIHGLINGLAIIIVVAIAAMWLFGCSTQSTPTMEESLQQVASDPNIPYQQKLQFIDFYNREKDDQRLQMEQNYQNALHALPPIQPMYQLQPVQPLTPWYVTHPTPSAVGYGNNYFVQRF